MSDDFYPNPGPQEEALRSTCFETLFGGARGGGKTAAGLAWMLRLIDNPKFRGLVIRRNADDLSDWVDRAAQMYKGYGAEVTYRPAVIKFPSGAIIRTGHLKDEQAYSKYQGHEYQRILIEELTQIPDEKRYLQLIASCRSTIPGVEARVFATTNPGGLGHAWVKERFVDPALPGQKFIDSGGGRSRIFIPSKVEDTPQLMANDPDYVKFLESLKGTDEELWKAWRMGDWESFAGAFFREFKKNTHVINPFMPEKDRAVLVSGFDWGYHAPACFSASALQKVRFIDSDGEITSFYRVKTFLEIYVTNLTPNEVAQLIKEKLRGFGLSLSDLSSIQADPAIFNRQTDGSISIREQFMNVDNDYRVLQPGSNDRIPGWAIMRNWLSFAPDGIPYWQLSTSCANGIKELQNAVYDENKVEDLDAEYDHFLDQARYMLKSLKWLDGFTGHITKERLENFKIKAQYFGEIGTTKHGLVDIDSFI